MSDEKSIWYRAGYALERARRPRAKAGRLEGLRARVSETRSRVRDFTEDTTTRGAVPVLEELEDSLGELGHSISERLGGLGVAPELRAGLAGAAAGLATEVVRNVLLREGLDPDDARDALLEGAAVGMAYGALLHRALPGPPWTRALVLGLASYAARGWGGLPRLLGPLSPHTRIPLISSAFDVERDPPDTLWEHLLFGAAMVAFYRSSRESKGTSSDV